MARPRRPTPARRPSRCSPRWTWRAAGRAAAPRSPSARPACPCPRRRRPPTVRRSTPPDCSAAPAPPAAPTHRLPLRPLRRHRPTTTSCRAPSRSRTRPGRPATAIRRRRQRGRGGGPWRPRRTWTGRRRCTARRCGERTRCRRGRRPAVHHTCTRTARGECRAFLDSPPFNMWRERCVWALALPLRPPLVRCLRAVALFGDPNRAARH